MKKRIVAVLLAALLLLAVPALALESSTNGLPTGTIVNGPATVYDGNWQGANIIGTFYNGAGVIIMQQLSDWTQVFSRADRIAGWVPSSSVRLDQASPIYPGIVISQSVSLRESPSTGARRLASIPNGAIFDLLDEQNGWYYVGYWDGKTSQPMQGWVRVDFVVRDPSFVTTTQSTYVYATPSRSAKKVGQVVEGTQLVVIGEFDDFWVVNLRSASGFIYKHDIDDHPIYVGDGGGNG